LIPVPIKSAKSLFCPSFLHFLNGSWTTYTEISQIWVHVAGFGRSLHLLLIGDAEILWLADVQTALLTFGGVRPVWRAHIKKA
jgi:hypothetical protein